MGRLYPSTNVDQVSTSGAVGMIGAIAIWCESLQGRSPIKVAIAELAKSFNAEAVALTRVSVGQQGNCASFIHDTVRGHARIPNLERSFANVVMGPYLHQAKPGTAWFNSLMDTDPDPLLDDFQRRRRLNELAVIPLAIEPKSTMLLELHFQDHRGSDRNALITLCAPTLAETWSRRKSGLMTEVLLDSVPPRPKMSPETVLLSDANPARLSRAEFRVCLLLSRGLSLRGVQENLGIRESTVRTHLRSIYAKTNTENQIELLFRLLSTDRTRRIDRVGAA